MNKKTVLILTFIIVLIIGISALFISTSAESATGTYGSLSYSIADGEITITDCDTSATTVVIPSIIETEDHNKYYVTAIASEAFEHCSYLTEITIPVSITSFGNDAFKSSNINTVYYTGSIAKWCNIYFEGTYSNPLCKSADLYVEQKNLVTDVSIPSTVTYIGHYAFQGCTSIKSITIPETVTNIGQEAFSGCVNLESVTIPSSMTKINASAFYACYKLKSVYINNLTSWLGINFLNSSSNPLCNGANLYINENLATDITIPEGITTISSSAFCGCTSITGVIIPEGVTAIGAYTFMDCTGLKSVTIPNSLTYIASMAFWNCINIDSVCISDLSAWCNIDFSYSSNPLSGASLYINDVLTENIIIPEGIETINKYAFYNYDGLRSLSIPSTVTSIKTDAFSSCDNLGAVYVSDLASWCNIEFGTDDTNPLYLDGITLFIDGKLANHITVTQDINSLDNIKMYSGIISVTLKGMTSIPDEFFSNFKSLRSVIIPDTVTSIGTGAFLDCYNLDDITISNSITDIKTDAFSGCIGLDYVYISDLGSWCSINFESYTSTPLQHGAKLCLNRTPVTDIVIPDSITSISQFAFYNCDTLTSVSIPSATTSAGIWAFYDCDKLASIYAPISLKGIQNEWLYDSDTNVTYYCTVKYIQNGEEIYTENVNLGETAKMLEVNVDYDYIYTTDSNLWSGSNITKDTTVHVTRVCTVKYEGDIQDEIQVEYGSSLTLPSYDGQDSYYKYTLDGNVIENANTIENITKHHTISVELVKYKYTITYEGVILDEQTTEIEHGETLTLPVCDDVGYNYEFSIGGEPLIGTTVENITQNITITVTKTIKKYTISYDGALSGKPSVEVEYDSNFTLPTCSEYGYYYTFKVNGVDWGNNDKIENITEDQIVYVTKAPREYTVTYTGDKTGTEVVKYGEMAKMFTAPYGYIYEYTTAPNTYWSGYVRYDITVTVTLVCDMCDIEDFATLHNWEFSANNIITASSYSAYLDASDIIVSENATAVLYSNSGCTSPINNNRLEIPKQSTSYISTAYIKVTAESGKIKIYTLNITREYISDIAFMSTGSGTGRTVVLQFSTYVYDKPAVQYAYADNASYEWVTLNSELVEFNKKLQILKFTLPNFNTDYDIRVIADYGDEEPITSHAEKIRTKQSDQCDFTVLLPSNATVDHINKTIYKNLENVYTEHEIKLDVSTGATYKLYQDNACLHEIADRILPLTAGINNEAYVKITAEDGYTSNIYKVILYRASRSNPPTISESNGIITINASAGSTIFYTTDGTFPQYGFAKAYYGPFCLPKGNYDIRAIAREADDDEFSQPTDAYHATSNLTTIAECSELSTITNGIKYEISLSTTEGNSINGTLIVAAYNSDNILLDIQQTPVNTAENQKSVQNTFRLDTSIAYLKVLFLNNTTEFKPRCPSLKLSL